MIARTLLALALWLSVGLASVGPVDRVLRDHCQGSLASGTAVLGHVAVWPVSVLSVWGIRSRC